MKNMKRQKDMTVEDEPHRSEGVQYATGEEQRTTNSHRKKEAARPKQKRHSVEDVSDDESILFSFSFSFVILSTAIFMSLACPCTPPSG